MQGRVFGVSAIMRRKKRFALSWDIKLALTIALIALIVLLVLCSITYAASNFGDIYPITNNTYVLGTSTYMWKNIAAAQYLYGTISCSQITGGSDTDFCTDSTAGSAWEGNYTLVQFMNNATLQQWLYNQTTQSLNAAIKLFVNMSNTTLNQYLVNQSTPVYNYGNTIWQNMSNVTLQNALVLNETQQTLTYANTIYQNMSNATLQNMQLMNNATLQNILGLNQTQKAWDYGNTIWYNMTNNTFNYMINQSLLTTSTNFGGEVSGTYNNLVLSHTDRKSVV